MGWFSKRPKVGATVIGIGCRGCMASNHVALWVGEIVGFSSNAHAPESADVKIYKRFGGPGDSRDRDLGIERPVWDNGAFQRIAPNFYHFYT